MTSMRPTLSGRQLVSDPVAFGLARLAEEAAEARSDQESHERLFGDAPWAQVLCDPVIGPFGGQSRLRNVGTGMYVAKMSDPGRVLRDVGNKRAILAEHAPYDCSDPAGQRCDVCVSHEVYPGGPHEVYPGGPHEVYPSGVAVHQAWPCSTVRRLIARWDDHPEFRQEWAVD
jgi:Family of unknown function (DUF6221)